MTTPPDTPANTPASTPVKTTLANRIKQLRWKHWVMVVLALIYLLYVALSYLYLPEKVKQVVATDVAELLGRKITIQRFEFNPFALSFSVYGLEVPDQPEQPLLAWDQLYVNFAFWGSLVDWEIDLQDVRLVGPHINIAQQKDGFNFQDILQRLAASEEPEPETAKKPTRIALQVDRTAIAAGVFRYTDFSGAQPARSEMDDINIELSELYLATGDEHLNPFNITAAIPGGGAVKMAGEYRLDPLYVETDLDVAGVQLQEFSDFVANVIPLQVTNGEFALKGNVLVQEQDDNLQVNVKGADLSLAKLAVDDSILDPPMTRIESFTVSGINLDLLQRSVTVDSVRIHQPVLNQWLDKEGRPRFHHLLVEQVVEENVAQQNAAGQTPAPAATAPDAVQEGLDWSVLVKQIQLDDGLFHFSDQDPAISQQQVVSDFNVNLENFTLTKDQTVPVKVSARLNDQGVLNLDGSMTLVPFKMQLNYGLQDLPLTSVSDYVQKSSYLRIEKGALDVQGKVQLDTADELVVNNELGLQVKGFQAEDTRTGKPVLQFQALNLEQVILDTTARNVTVASVTLQAPDTVLAIARDGQINWASMTRPTAPAAATPAEENSEATVSAEQTEAPWHYSIGAVALQKGSARFEDHSLSPAFKAGLYSLDFKLEKVDSNGTKPIPFTLSSKVDRYAPFSVKGTLDPIAQQPGFQFKSQLKGLEMPALSPYSAQFIAYNLKSGKLNLDLDYQVHNNKMKGDNQVVADQLYLGEKVPNEDAIDAPVALGLALLRDVNGVIDLDVGVSGDLDDPGFSVSGVILKAFINLLAKAATSPFKLLGSLAGGSEDMGQIEFAAGLAQLGDDNQQRLSQLKDALNQRQQLIVDITGAASAAEDTAMLQKLRVQMQVADERKMSLVELQEEAGEQDWWTVRANRRALADMATALQLPDEGAREQTLQQQQPELKGDALQAAVYRSMYDDVAQHQAVTNTDLLQLADSRALAIKQYLVDELQFDHERLVMNKAATANLDGRVIHLQLDAR